MSRMKFLNTEIDNLNMDEAVEAIDELINNRENSYVVTPNVDHILRLEDDKEFAEIYKNASFIFPPYNIYFLFLHLLVCLRY